MTDLKVKRNRQNNLSKEERDALSELKRRDDLIITKADKGGAVVIMDVKDYISEANRQLEDTTFYKKLKENPTTIHGERINNTIDRFKTEGLLNEKVAEGLKSVEPRTSKFYLNPKIHKKGNPGRPVIDSLNCHSTKLSKYVDFHLQPIVKDLKSYTKDSTDTINKLRKIQGQIKKDDILVTMDVRSLYTNIPNDEGIQAVRQKLNESSSRISTRVITTFLFLILTLNNFIFNGINYLQTLGCAMGTKCAPTYANIFMGVFEERHIYPYIMDKIRVYMRYIDDIFFIWKGTESELDEFLKHLNEKHATIKFDYEKSKMSINFLDLTIYKDEQGKLATKLYTKPTDRQAFLHKHSSHPNHMKKSIPYGQALRLKRICSNQNEYDEAIQQLKTKLISRGYKIEEIEEQLKRVSSLKREDLLTYKEKERMTKIPFITTYHPQLPNIRNNIHKHWNILKINKQLGKIFDEKPIIAYRRNKNLRDIIGQKTLMNNKVIRKREEERTNGQCKPCNSRRFNLCCQQIRNTKTFRSTQTKKDYKIFHLMNCKSNNVIYLLECNLCPMQYIGKSEWPMNIRLNKHRNDVRRTDAIDVCKHFNQATHNFNKNAKITIIEQIKNQNKDPQLIRKILEKREDFWIKELKTLHPYGFNKELNNIS